MKVSDEAISRVAEVYRWIDNWTKARGDSVPKCKACGKCCDFDTWGHRLYVSSAEIAHFAAKMERDKMRQMWNGKCPYNENGKCTVYENRFVGCRVFLCGGNSDFQSQLSEDAISQLKIICEDCGLVWQYADLKTALNELIFDYF